MILTMFISKLTRQKQTRLLISLMASDRLRCITLSQVSPVDNHSLICDILLYLYVQKQRQYTERIPNDGVYRIGKRNRVTPCFRINGVVIGW